MKLYFSLVTLLATADAAGVGNFFTYYEAGGLGPSRWQFLEIDGNQCGGMEGATGFGQSPVTISNSVRGTSGSQCDSDKSKYSFEAGDCKWSDLKFSISNSGVKVEPKDTNACSFGKMNIPHTANKFNALQFHIHTYSEHQIAAHPKSIDGSGFFPAELHVVHQEETQESYAVFGTMISVGDLDHPDFEFYLKGLEAVANEVADSCPAKAAKTVQVKTQCQATNVYPYPETNTSFPDVAVNLYTGLPTDDYDDLGFFTYKGGLTTPGCTEIVNWNLLDQPMEISQSQLKRLEYLIHCYVEPTKNAAGTVTSCTHATVSSESGSTSRPPQPLLGRTVMHRCENGPSATVKDIGVLPAPGSDFTKPAPESEPANTESSPKCDKTLREGCSDDKRYNPMMSPNLKANSPVWNDVEGYWVGTKTVYDNTGAILLETFGSSVAKNTKPYPQDEVFMFMNRTIHETRYYDHLIHVYKPADSDLFCTYAVPTNSTNVLGKGACGVNGYSMHGEKFGTATHEKDGNVHLFAGNGLYSGADTGRTFPIDSDTLYSTISGKGFEYTETFAFSNAEKTRITGTGQYFIKSDVLPYSKNPLAESYTYEVNQVDEATYMKMLADAYAKQSVLKSDQETIEMVSGYCLDTKNCPTESSFAQSDPLTTSTPYTDDSQIKGGWIAFFVIIGFLLMVALGWYWHTTRLAAQANRYKHQFARRVAETIQIDATHDKLSASDLEKEFKNIDTEGRGVITKDELKVFMGERINDQDFKVMFAAIDLDHNGTIEFSEFVAFMAQIGAIYDEEEMDVVAKGGMAPKKKEPVAEPEVKKKEPVAEPEVKKEEPVADPEVVDKKKSEAEVVDEEKAAPEE